MPEKIEFPQPGPKTPPFREAWSSVVSNVGGFSHYEDDDPNLPRYALHWRVIWREFEAMKKRIAELESKP